MGYSISVNCKSPQARDRMRKFLGKNFRPWGVVLGGPEDAVRYISDPSSNLAYAHGRTQIGFDYKAGWGNGADVEREFYFAVLRWVAIRVGRRARVHHHDGQTFEFDVPTSYIIYDGYDPWPVVSPDIRPRIKSLSWCRTNGYGVLVDKDTIAERYRGLIWDHLIKPIFSKWKKRDAFPTEFKVVPEVWPVLGRTPEEGLAQADIGIKMQARLVRTLLWDKVEALRAPIHAELKRLDQLWALTA